MTWENHFRREMVGVHTWPVFDLRLVVTMARAGYEHIKMSFGVDGDAFASRARHRSPPAPSARKRKTQSRGASAALLAARALVASAFLATGAARVYELGTDPEFDGTLGTLLPLAQLALAVPLAAGYGVGATARAAAACLASICARSSVMRAVSATVARLLAVKSS